MSVRFTLDSTVLGDTPRGWDDAKITSKRDATINGLFTEYTTELEFWGDGFTYIDSVVEDDGYCSLIDVLIESDDCTEGEFVTEFQGVIPITQISEVNVDEAFVKVKLLDTGFNARIANNKKLKAIVDTGVSKNGLTITPVTPVDIDFYDPTEDFNDYSFADRECYRIFDCFRFIIDHITDGTVGFVSDLFDVGGELYNRFILTGFELRQGSGNGEAPDISFQEMFKELSKKYNLGFGIEPDGYSGFNVRIEFDDFFRDEVEAFKLNNVRNITYKFNIKRMYSAITLGSQQYELATSLSFPPVRLKGWREETYTIQGECNLDNELNLLSKWIVDSNTIEDVLTNLEDAHDDKIFLVETDGTKTIKHDTFNVIRSAGSTTADTANKLRDGGADFVTDGVTVGDKVVNETTGLTAEVTAVDSLIQLSLDADIFTANPEDYRILAPPFTYNNGLNNYNSALRWLGAIPNSIVKYFGSGDDNFRATLTANINYTVFPASTNPIVYDDDSTPPNFDDNANYDNTNGRYAIPADGLYVFRSFNLFRVFGSLGPELVSDGDFSTGIPWVGPVGSGTPLSNNRWEITGNEARIFSGEELLINNMFWQSVILVSGKHVLTFEITSYTSGKIQIATSSNGNFRLIHGEFDTVGVHTVRVELFGSHNRIEFIGKRVITTPGQGSYFCELSIDNVSIKALPRFRITSRIRRFNANLQQLQVWTMVKDIATDFLERVKFDYVQLDTPPFGAFEDDIIRADITIEDLIGTGTRVDLLSVGVKSLAGLDTHFESLLVEDGGGELIGVDTNEFIAYMYEFEKPLSLQEFRDIVNIPKNGIVFNRGIDPEGNILGWREEISYEKQSGKIICNLVSKQKIDPCP